MARLLQIFISVLAMGILSEAKHEGKHHIHKTHTTYTSASDEPVNISLNCSETAMQGAPVYWEKQDNEQDPDAQLCHGTSRNVLGSTGQLKRTIRGPPDAGVYICCSAKKLLSRHTVLFGKKTVEGEIVDPMLMRFEEFSGTYLKCMANSYSGNFTCSWKTAHQDPYLNFTIRPIYDNTSGGITCDEPKRNSIGESSEYTVSCKKNNSCPSAEEYQPITISLEVVNLLVYVYEEHTSTFFIKDIIKPDAPECQFAKHGLKATLTWRHPDTWTTPESYFGLTYQIETSGRKTPSIFEVKNTTLLRNGSTLSCYIQTRGDKFRIRSRDRYYTNDAAWSSWSEPCRNDHQTHDKLHGHNQEGRTNIEPCN